MASQNQNTFKNLSSTLQALGYTLSRHGSTNVFIHPDGPAIFLPPYESDETVRPIHIVMVKRQLLDAGLIEPDQVTIPRPPKAAPKLKKSSKSGREVEA